MRMLLAGLGLMLAMGLVPNATQAASTDSPAVSAPIVVLGVFDDCWNCHTCQEDENQTLMSPSGASTLTTNEPRLGCQSFDLCDGCGVGEEDLDTDAELALTQLIEAEGEGILTWMEEYGGNYAFALAGSTLQVSRKCGQAITWLALDTSTLASATELLDQ